MSANNRRRTTTAALEAKIAQLEAIINHRAISPVFGCLVRSALEDEINQIDLTGFALVYIDVDEMKRANEDYTKEGANVRIKTSIAGVRETDVLIGQWFSGDEFVAIVPADRAISFAERLGASFRANGLSISAYVIALYAGVDIEALTYRADTELTSLKLRNIRGVVHNAL